MTQYALGSQRQIKNVHASIEAMDPGAFEDFCYELLSSQGRGFENIQHSSSAFGKPRRGKCDLHVYHHDTHQVTAVTCTTQKQRVKGKIGEDIDSLQKSKFAHKIRTVLACIASNAGEALTEYHETCEKLGWRFEPWTLQRLACEAVKCDAVMRRFFYEFQSSSAVDKVSEIELPPNLQDSRLFLAGERLKKVRNDLDYSEGQFIESVLGFPSQLRYRDVEADRLDVEEHYLNLASQYSGADFSWLKVGVSVPYPGLRLSRYNFQRDLRDDGALYGGSKRAVIALDSKSMTAVLLIEESAQRWNWWYFDDRWDIWNWVYGDEKYVPEFLRMIKYIDRRYHPHAFIINTEKLAELQSGQVHPGAWQKALWQSPMSMWFDDLFDYHHRISHLAEHYKNYGDWFLQIQEALRLNGEIVS